MKRGFISLGAAIFAFVFSSGLVAETRIAGATQPQLAAGANGTTWLAYGSGHEVWVARSDDGGATFLPGSRVTNLPQLMLGMRRGPRIAVCGTTVTVTVVAPELLAYRSTDGGRTWSGPARVNDVAGCAREGLHDLAANSAGELFITWLDLRNGKTELWCAASRDGGASWTKNERVYQSPDTSICECCHPSALYDGDGNLAVMWRNSIEGSRDLWMAIRAPGAKSFSPALKVGTGTWKLQACPMDGGRIVTFGGGKFGAIFQRAGDIFFVDDSGAEIPLGRGKQPVALREANLPLAVWQDGTNLVSTTKWGRSPGTRATNARFAVLLRPPGKHYLIAYEQGESARRPAGIVIERLAIE